eukprot:scaffold204625_cov21-Tisochrysis_lutea.AAC.2
MSRLTNQEYGGTALLPRGFNSPPYQACAPDITAVPGGALFQCSLQCRGTFNLCAQDLENTTGAWDMYGVDEKKRYPGMQEEFFQRATDAVSRRESLNGFVALCKWEGCWCEYVCASLFKLFMVSTDSACK